MILILKQPNMFLKLAAIEPVLLESLIDLDASLRKMGLYFII
jgi:hypothetical protein